MDPNDAIPARPDFVGDARSAADYAAAAGTNLYPIMGMTDWHDPDQWLPMGLWESSLDGDGVTRRHVHTPKLEALRAANMR